MTELSTLPLAVKTSAAVLFALRAANVELMDLRGVKDVTDYFLVATCESEAQMQAILAELEKEFKASGLQALGVEYRSGVRWAIFDAGLDLMVHLFEEAKREEIQLARLYSDAKIETLDEADFEGDTKTGVADGAELV